MWSKARRVLHWARASIAENDLHFVQRSSYALVFRQNAEQRLVFHHEFFQLLQQEAQL